MPSDPRAVLTRAAPEPDVTVAYGEHPDQIADLRRPAGSGPPRPLVVVVHGGFWRAEYDRRHTGPLASALAALGYPVAQLEYRRTGQPGGGWPGTLTDVLAGVSALPRLPTWPRRTGWTWTPVRWPRCSAAARPTCRSGTRRRIHDPWSPYGHAR